MPDDDRFYQIADRARQDAAAVKCSTEEYRDGLQQIIDELEMAKEAAESDIERQQRTQELEDAWVEPDAEEEGA